MKKIFALSLLILIGMSFVGLVFADVVPINDPIGAKTIKELLEKIADGVALIIGPISGIMFIVAGILYLTSAGSPERMNNAKACVTYAIIGIVVALSAKGLATWIASTLT